MRKWLIIAALVISPIFAAAEDRLVVLQAPVTLVDTGLMKYVLPRFSLKTQVRVNLTQDRTDANVSLGQDGRPLFEGAGSIWSLSVHTPDHPGTAKFVDWLTSEIGMRTLTSFAPDGEPMFQPPTAQAVEVAEISFDGNAASGHEVSRTRCGRCHAVDEAGRKKSIGSTPSFFVLRSLSDWQDRFAAFYALKPHPAFTQIADVTDPFPEDRPSPIVPVHLTLDELEDVLAYVAVLEAADLGQPLQHQ